MKTKDAVEITPAAELVRLLRVSRVAPAGAVHDHGCPCTVHGKKFGLCNCPAGPIEAQIVKVYQRLGLACKACGAYKARRGSGHYMTCRYTFGGESSGSRQE